MYLSVISEICTRASFFKPMSMNAPKSITFRTVPSNSIPGFKSSIVKISLFSIGEASSSLGSLRGDINDLIISSKV